MKTTKLDAAIKEAAKKLCNPINPAKHSGYYKYWSGLLEAKKLILDDNS